MELLSSRGFKQVEDFVLVWLRYLTVGDYVLHSFPTDFSPQTMKPIYVYNASDCLNPGELHWIIIFRDYFGCFYLVLKYYYISTILTFIWRHFVGVVVAHRCCSSLFTIMMVIMEHKHYINIAWLPVWQYITIACYPVWQYILSTWGKYCFPRRSRG